MIYRRTLPRPVAPALPVAAWAGGAGAQSVAPPVLDSTAQAYAPVVGVGTVVVAPNAVDSTAAVGSPTLGNGAIVVQPPALASSAVVGAPAVSVGAVTVTPPAIGAGGAVGAPSVGVGVVALAPPTIPSAAQVFVPVIGTGTLNWNVQVGDGYTDVSPKQLVRTRANVLYTIAPNCDTYPDLSANGLTQTIRVHKANSTGVPTGFTRKDSSNEPAAVVGCAAALDSSDNIRIVWAARSSSTNTRYLRYAIFNTATDTWGSVTTIASDLDYDDVGQGEQTVALAVDASDVCHIVYLSGAGTARRVYYRNNAGGSWSSATQIDGGVSYTGNLKAWHPNIALDAAGRRLVAWARGTFNGDGDTTIYTRVYSGGSWGSTVQASAETDLETGIDQSTSLLITPDGVYHLTYILHSATNGQKYIRYRYSTDQGATWTANNPSNQATHNPSLGWTGSKVRILGHGTPNASNHGDNLYYFEGDGGSGAWGSWTQFVTGTDYDCSVNTRWSQFNHHFPHTLDIAYWNDQYPNVLYAGTQVFALDVAASPLPSAAQVGSPSVSQGALTLAPPAVAGNAAVGAPVIGAGAVTVAPVAVAAGAAVGSPSVGVGSVTLQPPTVGSAAQASNPALAVGAVTLAPSFVGSSAQVGAPTVGVGVQTLQPPIVSSAAQVYAPALVVGAVAVTPVAVQSAAQVYSPSVGVGVQTLQPPTVPAAAQVGNPALIAGAVTVAPPVQGSTAQVFSPTIGVGVQTLQPPAILGAAVAGAPVVGAGAVALALPAVVAGALAGNPTVQPGPVVVVLTVGAGSGAQVGSPVLLRLVLILPPWIAPAAAVGSPTATPGVVTLAPTLVCPAGRVGTPALILLGIVTPASRMFVVAAEQRVFEVAAERREFVVEA